MKILLEFAKFRDLLNTNNDKIKRFINKDFVDDCNLLQYIFIKKYNKRIDLKWNDTKNHSIKKRIKDRTTLISVCEFNNIIRKGLEQVFSDDNWLGIDSGGRYFLYFKNNNFYLSISINYESLFDDDSSIFIVSLIPNVKDLDNIILINDDFF